MGVSYLDLIDPPEALRGIQPAQESESPLSAGSRVVGALPKSTVNPHDR